MSDRQTAAVDRCEMPECGSTDDLKRCRTPDDEPVRACSDCRSNWPRQLRVVGGEDE